MPFVLAQEFWLRKTFANGEWNGLGLFQMKYDNKPETQKAFTFLLKGSNSDNEPAESIQPPAMTPMKAPSITPPKKQTPSNLQRIDYR